MALSKPDKHLRYTEKHFDGYMVHLTALIRANEHADELMDGLLTNPIQDLLDVAANDPGRSVVIQLNLSYQNYKQLHPWFTSGFPPSTDLLTNDPVQCVKNLLIVTKKATTAGTGGGFDAANAWLTESADDLKNFCKASKHIWQVVVSTLTTEQATMLIGTLKYGAGQGLIKKLKEKQRRQTPMSLFTLFEQLITISVKPSESLDSYFSRATQLRQRLSQWDPPITLPDELIMVCLLRLLPKGYHSTRTIIMATQKITLPLCKSILLDAEGGDARLITDTIGSTKLTPGYGLLSDKPPPTGRSRRQRTKKAKSEKYLTEGHCEKHGVDCCHSLIV